MIRTLSLLLSVAVLSGCAAMNRLDNQVSSYGAWPAGKTPSTYAFERLPSQQQQVPREQIALEEAARPALEAVGFRAAADPASADVLVQLGAAVRADRVDTWPYRGFGWHGLRRVGYYGYGYGFGGRLSPGLGHSPTYDREVVVLIRDRRTGQTVYETRAATSGFSPSISSLLPAMFEAALKDFPVADGKPRRVVTEIRS
jgi:hypothetical protein